MSTITYSLHPIPVRRPAKGVRVARVRCGGCGAELTVRVYSARHTRWARSLLLLVGLVAVTAEVVIFGFTARSSGLLVVCAGVALIVVIAALVTSFYYDGVRLPWFSGLRGHALRRP